jgi:hypothetical protein
MLMKRAACPPEPIAIGDLVRVVQQSAPYAVKVRLYRVLKHNPLEDWFYLEWEEAPKGSRERYCCVYRELTCKV